MGRTAKSITLGVFQNGRRVGTLTTASGSVTFQYAESWLSLASSTAISASLPLTEAPYRGDVPSAFFENLLPDSDFIRRKISERFATQGSGAVELLSAIGRDCVGSLQFIANTSADVLPKAISIEGTPLTDKQIGKILRDLSSSPLGMTKDNDFRISLAGAQEKTALLWWKGRWHLPHGTTPTTHILKPCIPRVDGMETLLGPENEVLCLRLARHFGLPVANAEVLEFDGVKCISIERFDRLWSANGKTLSRIPQEDLCQAMGVPSSRKYESDGGPGIKAILDFLNASDERNKDREMFLRAQIVFFLLGGIDGHAKNFSLFITKGGFRMTPLYDILSIYPAIEARKVEKKNARFSMAVGKGRHYRLFEIKSRHWEETAKAGGISLDQYRAVVDDILDKAKDLHDNARLLTKGLSPKIAETIIAGIAKLKGVF